MNRICYLLYPSLTKVFVLNKSFGCPDDPFVLKILMLAGSEGKFISLRNNCPFCKPRLFNACRKIEILYFIYYVFME